MGPFSSLAFLQPTTVDKEPKSVIDLLIYKNSNHALRTSSLLVSLYFLVPRMPLL